MPIILPWSISAAEGLKQVNTKTALSAHTLAISRCFSGTGISKRPKSLTVCATQVIAGYRDDKWKATRFGDREFWDSG